MAVDAAEISYQQMQHLADSHAIILLARVETLRNLASKHPVSALMLRVSSIDSGIELIAARDLFNKSTALDVAFGFGAVGCIEFLANQMQFESVENGFEADIKTRGLEHLPIHKHAAYGKLYFDTLKTTIKAYLDVFYSCDDAVRDDKELQNWAKGCAAVAQLRDFPIKFKSVRALTTVLTHLLFQTTIRHHAMNDDVTWQAVSLPYSSPALWKKLPSKKLAANETLNAFEYASPQQLLPIFVLLSAKFTRFLPTSDSLFSFFKASSFTEEPKLAHVIKYFDKAIDAVITGGEQNEKWPYRNLRPSKLALYSWI